MVASVPGRAAILAPGGNYSTDGPLLMFAGLAVERRGGAIRPIAWTLDGSAGPEQLRAAVISQVTAALAETAAATGVAAPVVIGKSLGSLAAPVVADSGLAAVWFTPLLDDEPTVAALRRAAGPCLLVGGTADECWNGPAARSITPHVVEVDGADHRMFVPGELTASAAVLGRVMEQVEQFLDDVAWQQQPGSQPAAARERPARTIPAQSGMTSQHIPERVARHTAAFNAAVQSGNWGTFAARFSPDAIMRFADGPAGPIAGRDAIAQAYLRQPPTDTMTILAADSAGQHDTAAFAWSSGGTGVMRLTWQDQHVASLEVSFDD